MNQKQQFRARLALFGIFGMAGILAISLYRVQIIQGSTYAARADRQYVKPAVAHFDRGSIFFTAKDGTRAAAATVKSGYLLYMIPAQLGDPETTYAAIAHYLPDLDHDDFLQKAELTTDPYEELVHRVEEDIAITIGELGLPGIAITKENWRSYPGNDLAAQTVGLIGETETGTIEGRYGLESFYENILSRQRNGLNVFAELFSGIRDTVFGDGEDRGEIITAIEPTVQRYLEEVLAKASQTWKPEQIGGIVIDPHTGEIIAMGSLPSFNPNDLSRIRDIGVFSNPLVEHVYEMGSILKPLTMAVGLDTEAITPSSTYNDEGTMTLNGEKISNYDGKARGTVKMQEILSQSLNMGAATIALEVGNKEFTRYFKSFGFGEKTGIDQPNEATGIIGNLETGRDIETATAAYGQGIATSPIATARALAVLANGGFLVRPHLVKEVHYVDGSSRPIVPEKEGPILKKETADQVTTMLVKVVDEALRKGEFKIDHYSLAAKTGTAQIPDPEHGGYHKDRYLHSFFGYFPAYEARFLVFLYQKYPKNANFASETLAEPFSEITKFLVDYYDIPPDR